MKKMPTRAQRYETYCLLYTKISKATAEIVSDNKASKVTYFGKMLDLFEGVDVSKATLTSFLWAISHKTTALPVILFKIDRIPSKGIRVNRIHSGFYDNGQHIIGIDLIPYIMSAMKEYQPKARQTKKEVVPEEVTSNEIEEVPYGKLSVHQLSMESELATCFGDFSKIGEDTLDYFGKDAYARFEKAKSDVEKYEAEVERRAKVRMNQEKLNQVLELMEMTKEDLKDLIASCS